ncbi:MAG: solute carrier family 23 protein, partial [Clostridia bacterium]|nr:solute carrier family 23 protein [Clostridia bacterium]
VGIGAGLVFAILLTCIGLLADYKAMQIVDFTPIKECFSPFRFQSFFDYPKFTFIEAIKQGATEQLNGAAIGNLAVLFVPIAVVELAQHISDHENLSNIVEKDLLEDPGLHNTLLGDGVGSAVGAFFGGCANTTYGESISCVALSKNASTYTILATAVMCMLVSFVSPFVAIINMLPKCVMGGACIAMYGFISVSGLQMLKDVDLSDHRNLYPVAAILVIGIGGVTLDFGKNNLTGGALIQITALALAMAVGIIVNYITHSGKDNEADVEAEKPDSVVTD